MKLSIIIVNYNVTNLLRKCLLSIDKYLQDIDYEVIIVDNKSPDVSWKDLRTEFPQHHFIASETNGGFAIANNLAARKAVGEYLLLLNPDTEFESNDLKKVISFSDAQQNFGGLGVRMHDADGNFLPESKRSVPNIINSFEKLFTNFKKNNAKSYYREDVGEYEIASVDIVTGAFFLTKRAIYLEVGGLDEKYFMYGEDIDLCYTIIQHGYTNWYYGEVSILHHKGESTVKDEKYLERFYGAMQIFIDKYYKKQKPFEYQILKLGLKVRHSLEKRKIKRDS